MKIIESIERYSEIEYNQSGKPIKVSYFDYGWTNPEKVMNIEWEESSFIVTDSDWQDRKEIFNLNDKRRNRVC